MTGLTVRPGHCPKCGPDRSSDIVAKHHESYNDDKSGVWGSADYRILKCRGCGSVYYQESTIDSEDQGLHSTLIDGNYEFTLPERITHWPPPLIRSKPEWSTQPNFQIHHHLLHRLLDDVYGSLNANLLVPASVAARTAFDVAAERLGVDSTVTFKKKMDKLKELGHIGDNDRKTLNVLVEAGNAAVHRGWQPNLDQLDTIISILDGFLYRTFVLNRKADSLQKKVPSKTQAKKSP